jgi:hypothetical protein
MGTRTAERSASIALGAIVLNAMSPILKVPLLLVGSEHWTESEKG